MEEQTRTFEVTGPAYRFGPPPERLQVSVVQRTENRSFDGQALLSLVLAVNWATLATDVGVHLFSEWLYDLFKKPDKGESSDREHEPEIKVRIDGNVNIIVVTDPQAVEAALRKIVDGI